nr:MULTISPECIES: TetR/AcrR family transcriptional regulator [unclassified Pseudomonas]
MVQMTPIQRRIYNAAACLFAEKGITQIGISDLARAAGVSRATVHSEVGGVEDLFERVASQQGREMQKHLSSSFLAPEDPAECLANCVRIFIYHAHVDRQWGSFISRFALGDVSLRELFLSHFSMGVRRGLEEGRYEFGRSQSASVISLIAGATLGAMFMVREGVDTWRGAGSETAELLLRALGVSELEARELATRKLPALSCEV